MCYEQYGFYVLAFNLSIAIKLYFILKSATVQRE